MGNFQRGDRNGNRDGRFQDGGRGSRQRFGGERERNNRGPISMHKAVCDKCHKNCEVPFRPSGDKPIYCNECFGGKRNDDNRGQRKDFSGRKLRRDFNDKSIRSSSQDINVNISDDVKKQLNEINIKLDHLMNVVGDLSIGKTSNLKESNNEKVSSKKDLTKIKEKKIVAKKKK